MVIAIFGESCTGKSTIANQLAKMAPITMYTGKSYMKLAKNEAEAREAFRGLLEDHQKDDALAVYVISEKDQLSLLPAHAFRVLVTAELAQIQARFAQRMQGNLPTPVADMIERKHGMFDDVPCALHIRSGSQGSEQICERILAACKGATPPPLPCKCPDVNCPRHGHCDACSAFHNEKGTLTKCRRPQAQ